MADQFDRAQDLDAYYRQQALDTHARAKRSAGESRTACIDCGDEIPEARRRVLSGCIRCRECAELFEASRRRL